MASRHKHPPWGFAGGHDGSINDVQVHRSAGGYESRATWSNEPLAGGDLVRFISGGGGGYGNPHNRPADKVLDDWKNQYITATEALEYFGVVIDEVAQTVDEVQTKLKRQI